MKYLLAKFYVISHALILISVAMAHIFGSNYFYYNQFKKLTIKKPLPDPISITISGYFLIHVYTSKYSMSKKK